MIVGSSTPQCSLISVAAEQFPNPQTVSGWGLGGAADRIGEHRCTEQMRSSSVEQVAGCELRGTLWARVLDAGADARSTNR